MMRLSATAFAFIFLLYASAGAGSGKWETSLGASLSGARGNTENTDAELRASFVFDGGPHGIKSEHKYRLSEENGDETQNLWRSNFSYLRKISQARPAADSADTQDMSRQIYLDSLYLSVSSFAERDKLSGISLRSGIGAGPAAKFLGYFTTQAAAGIDWLREDRVSAGALSRAALRLEKASEKIFQSGVKMKAGFKFFIPLTETGDFFTQSSTSLEFPVAGGLSFRAAFDVDYDNEPASQTAKKTDFRYSTGLTVSF